MKKNNARAAPPARCGAASLSSPADTAALAAKMAPLLRPPFALYLSGPLAAGKTFFVRALLTARLGKETRAPSPTFALGLFYPWPPSGECGEKEEAGAAHHYDLYRLRDGGGWREIGLADSLADEAAVCLVEWPEHGRGLPPPDAHLSLAHGDDIESRRATLTAHTPRAAPLLSLFAPQS